MPSKSATRSKKSTSKADSTTRAGKKGQVDIVLGGPLLIVPQVVNGKITGVEVFSPANGHPMGATFVPEIWFSDAELEGPDSERWPDAESLSLLDPHSYAIELSQSKKAAAFGTASIPETNHKVKPGRRVSSHWEVAIAIYGQLSGWTSHRLMEVKEGLFHGSDSPTATRIAGMHRLTYDNVTGGAFYGAAREPKEYLSANIARGGTLIITGEVPYSPSLMHERQAISSLAKLAGLNLHLATTIPTQGRSQLTTHVSYCLSSVVLVE